MNTQIKRMIAGMIDIMVLSIASASFFAVIFSLSLLMSYIAGININQIKVMSSFTMVAIITMYETIFLYFFKGKTLGKWILGFQVRKINEADSIGVEHELGSDLDIYTCLLRGLVKGIVIAGFSGIFLILNLILIVLGQTSTMIYDKIAKTTVEIEGGR